MSDDLECRAVQRGDMTECDMCNVRWGTNDPCPPACQIREWDEKRIDIIGLNGNNGEHYEELP